MERTDLERFSGGICDESHLGPGGMMLYLGQIIFSVELFKSVAYCDLLLYWRHLISFKFKNINTMFPRSQCYLFCRAAGIVGAKRARPAAAATRHVTAVPSANTRTGKSTITYAVRLCRRNSRERPPPPSAPQPPPAAEPAAPQTRPQPPPPARPRPARPPP